MTDIEQKALALVNEVRTDRGFGLITWFDREEDIDDIDREALCRAIEQHEAFRQEVSDAAAEYDGHGSPMGWTGFERFIIAKPDPLVEVFGHENAEQIRATIEERGGKIVWGEG